MFTALRACTTLAMIGAVVSEFFGGPMKSLGVYIKSTASLFQTREAWSAIPVACVLGSCSTWRWRSSSASRYRGARGGARGSVTTTCVRIETHAMGRDGDDETENGTAWLALTC